MAEKIHALPTRFEEIFFVVNVSVYELKFFNFGFPGREGRGDNGTLTPVTLFF